MAGLSATRYAGQTLVLARFPPTKGAKRHRSTQARFLSQWVYTAAPAQLLRKFLREGRRLLRPAGKGKPGTRMPR